MAKRSLKPCRHPGCPELTRDGGAPKHRPAPRQSRRGASGAYHSWYSKAAWTQELRPAQLLRNLSAGSVRPRGGAPPATVVDHVIPLPWRLGLVCQSGQSPEPVQVPPRPEDRPGTSRKQGEKRASFEGAPPWKAMPARPGGRVCVCIHLRAQARRQSRGPPPGSEKFWGILPRPRCSLVCEKKSPMENLERRFCLCQLT